MKVLRVLVVLFGLLLTMAGPAAASAQPTPAATPTAGATAVATEAGTPDVRTLPEVDRQRPNCQIWRKLCFPRPPICRPCPRGQICPAVCIPYEPGPRPIPIPSPDPTPGPRPRPEPCPTLRPGVCEPCSGFAPCELR